MVDQEALGSYSVTKILNKQVETGKNNFVGVLEISQRPTATKCQLSQEKDVGNFVKFFTFSGPTPSQKGMAWIGESSGPAPVPFLEPERKEQS